MMAKPMKTLKLHYPLIQFLIILNIQNFPVAKNIWIIIKSKVVQFETNVKERLKFQSQEKKFCSLK